jgi:hypothetical protein
MRAGILTPGHIRIRPGPRDKYFKTEILGISAVAPCSLHLEALKPQVSKLSKMKLS